MVKDWKGPQHFLQAVYPEVGSSYSSPAHRRDGKEHMFEAPLTNYPVALENMKVKWEIFRNNMCK